LDHAGYATALKLNAVSLWCWRVEQKKPV